PAVAGAGLRGVGSAGAKARLSRPELGGGRRGFARGRRAAHGRGERAVRPQVSPLSYFSRFHLAVTRAASPPGAQITSARVGPALPVLWRTWSGGRTKPTIPGFSVMLLPLTTCSSSPEST